MTRKRRLLLIDPGMKTPANTTYNLLSTWVADFRADPDFSVHSVQFVVSYFCKTRLRDVAQDLDLAGIISLGSHANVTDHLDWVETLHKDLEPLLFEQKIPFMGICFSHQLLAHMGGNQVGFLANALSVPNREHVGFRETQLTHPKFATLWATLKDSDLASRNGVDLEFREALRAVGNWTLEHWDFVFAAENSSKLTPEELRVKTFVTKNTPASYIARVAHEQEVLSLDNPSFRTAAESPECRIDALVHANLPLFSLQSHPETYHVSQDGWRMLRNFVYFVGLHDQVSHD